MEEVKRLKSALGKRKLDYEDVLTEEIIANSEIEGVFLDRDSVHSSFVKNITPAQEKESGAVALMKMSLEHYSSPLSHELLFQMHREILRGSNFPDTSIGNYVGDMKIVSGNRLDQEYKVIHEGVSKQHVHGKMDEFITWFNQCSPNTPLVNAIQGHIHFETIHPFCDGNGRIGRSLILMGLCRDLNLEYPLALSRAFNSDHKTYYSQFETGLDLTDIIKSLAPSFTKAVAETERILSLTAYRARIADQADSLNERQLKVLNRLVDYELRGGFEGGMSNIKYQKMTGIGDRTALRDLNELCTLEFVTKEGQLKGTRYFLNL